VLIAVVAGGLLGIMLGTVGGGGAVLAVPVLVYLLGQTVHAATTGSLIIVVGAAGVAAVGHARRGAVCWRLAAAFAAAAVPGSIIGTAVNHTVAGGRLLGAFAVLLLAVAMLTWRRSGPTAEAAQKCPDLRWGVVALAGLGVGVLTGLFGVGGGFAVVPVLALGLRVPFRRAIATSLVVVAVVSAVGLVEHLAAGAKVEWGTALLFAGAAMVAAAFGGRVAARLPRRTLARGFAAVLAGVAIYLMVSVAVLGGPPHG
jgi:uncharacterized protein